MRVHAVSDDFCLDNVIPYFQPIIDVQQQTVWGYECLARLLKQGSQTFLPCDFLYLIDKNNGNAGLTQHIFHQSAEYFRHHQVNWGINISKDDVLDPATVTFLQSYLKDYPNAHRVTLEIQAKTALQYQQEFKAFLLISKALGIKVVVDHFGGVASSIEGMLEMPIDGIKIEAKLLIQLASHIESKQLLNTLLKKAKSNDVVVIAEHIEDAATLAAIDKLHIQFGQGFYISQPSSSA